jgi:hypothetical protein
MTITAIRVPERVHSKAVIILKQYRQGGVRPCRIKCGNISLKVTLRWRLLSRNDGADWLLISHEAYNKMKDKRG